MIGATVSSGVLVLVGAVFLACTVEMVEALTIVFAVGHTRGWRSALQGVVVALLALGALVGAFGPALVHVPLTWLRLIVGGILLIFGLQWLRKAVLRASGLKAKHDEDVIYAETVEELRALGNAPSGDRIAFAMAFKGVFLEGLEVVITVLTLGTSAHRLGLASIVAGVAVVLVAVVGIAVSKQLSAVPENAMKTSVGVLLISYGTFWVGEALKVKWPGNDGFLLALVVFYGVSVWLLITATKATTTKSMVAA
jgi:uncharacterized membrane protein